MGRHNADIKLIAMSTEQVEVILSGKRALECQGCEFVVDEILPMIITESALFRYRAGEEWFWCAPRLFTDTSLGIIVGSGAFKNSPISGSVEIGYGIAPQYVGKGYATIAVACLLNEGFSRDEITRITAETSITNIASERVLKKNGFMRTGGRDDPEDGPLNQWRIARKAYLHPR